MGTMRVAITGASGLVGRALVPLFAERGWDVVRLVRRSPAAKGEAGWNPQTGDIDTMALGEVDVVVHLAGENIAGGRWTARRKELLRSSRVGPTRALAEALGRMTRRPKAFVSASAVGYYGDQGDTWVQEDDGPGTGFLCRLAQDWEKAAGPAAEAGIRVVYPRIGIVLTPSGGALQKMLLPFRMGLGGRLGSGRQYMSWISLGDLVLALLHMVERDDLAGAVNVVTPSPVTNALFTKALGQVLHRPTVMRVPGFLLRFALGEMADAALLASTRVRPARLDSTGFVFHEPELEGALGRMLTGR
jgi:uncharacterized protein (TIGR01777 family)